MLFGLKKVVVARSCHGNGEQRIVISDGSHKKDKLMFSNEEKEEITTIVIRVNGLTQFIRFNK